MIKARIIKLISNRYTVLTEDNQTMIATAMGKLRLGKSPVAGDEVSIEYLEDRWVIQKVLERRNELVRPLIANVDQAVILTSMINPDFSTVLLDRLIFLISYAHIEPVIVVSKCDLVSDDHPAYKDIEEYRKAGYKVFTTGKGWDTSEIESVFEGKISVLTGQSGAGKSSLINRMNPDFTLNTQEISMALGRGKHTTRHVELHPVAKGWVADTPGFSSLDFSTLSKDELAWDILDFKPYLGKCKFRNCIHDNEPGCAVKEAVLRNEVSRVRYQNYLDVLQLIDQGRKLG
ncbi:MAG TPA: ribosome small subunit-dependent GTPase A [Erysipelotrichaceae bacterium]|nr:ribosome small subunit-dependent GTPase A [Erysipelotrichaceae bacterium]